MKFIKIIGCWAYILVVNTVFAQAPMVSLVKEKEEHEVHTTCMTTEIADQMEQIIQADIAKNRAEGKIRATRPKTENNRNMITYFQWPLRMASNYEGYSYYEITNYVDQNATSISNDNTTRNPLEIDDWNCGKRTYDGHRGWDISLYPFWWFMQDGNFAEVIAAAPGEVISVIETNLEQCDCVGSDPNNAITVEHADGSQSRYFHIKTNSAVVNVGDIVQTGDLLAYVGSVGCSSNPHLHFEVRDINNNVIEPAGGSCNNMMNGTTDWWGMSFSYWEPQILRLHSHSTTPTTAFCRSGEATNFRTNFSLNSSAYLTATFRDIQQNDTYTAYLYRPDGTLRYSNASTYTSASASRFLRTYDAVTTYDQAGTWRFAVSYRGKVYDHYFTVTCTDYALSGAHSGHQGYWANTYITSTRTISGSTANEITYKAGNYIRLDPGFTATQNSYLHAHIEPCGSTADRDAAENEYVIEDNAPPVFRSPTAANEYLIAQPNPFSNQTDFVFALKNPTTVSLFIKDIYGREVTKIIHQQLYEAGTYQANFQTNNLPSGIYTAVFLEGDKIKQTLKLVVSK